MIINSKFKDYYDFCGIAGDPSVQYIRNRLMPLQKTNCLSFVESINIVQLGLLQLPYADYDLSFKWLCVAGKQYLLVSDASKNWKVFSEENHRLLWEKYNSSRYMFFRNKTKSKDYVGVFSSCLVELSRKIGAPVFTFTNDRNNNVKIDGNIPILRDIGIPKIITAEQMYQDIAYFMGNIIKESPDLIPPSKLSDKEKIIQHGFDTRISFRNRV